MDRIEREDESWFGVGIAAPEGSFFFFFRIGSDRPATYIGTRQRAATGIGADLNTR